MPVIRPRAPRQRVAPPWSAPIGNGTPRPVMLARLCVPNTRRPVISALQASRVAADFGLGHREAGALMQQLGREREGLPGRHERSQLRLFQGREERHARELGDPDDEPARGLGHGLDEQDPRHQRQSGKVSLKDGGCGRNPRLGTDSLIGEIEIDDTIDQLKVLDAHCERVRRPWQRQARRCGCTGCSTGNIARSLPCRR